MIFRKKPYIEFWATVQGIEKTSPILPAREILPEWWKNMPVKNSQATEQNIFTKAINDAGTVKRCPGIKKILMEGWVLTMWCDLVLKVVDGNIVCQYSLPGWEKQCFVHPSWQMIDHLPENAKNKYLYVFKPGCPWLVKTSQGYNTLHLDPFYFFNPNFDSAEGVQESDIYHDMSPQLLLKKEEVFIPKGTPLQIIIPIKRESIEGKIIPHNDKTAGLSTYNFLIAKSKFSPASSYNEHIKRNNKCPFS